MVKQKLVLYCMNFPLDGDIFDYYLDFKFKRFKPWSDKVLPFKYDA